MQIDILLQIQEKEKNFNIGRACRTMKIGIKNCTLMTLHRDRVDYRTVHLI
jgi:hypothetical protein